MNFNYVGFVLVGIKKALKAPFLMSRF